MSAHRGGEFDRVPLRPGTLDDHLTEAHLERVVSRCDELAAEVDAEPCSPSLGILGLDREELVERRIAERDLRVEPCGKRNVAVGIHLEAQVGRTVVEGDGDPRVALVGIPALVDLGQRNLDGPVEQREPATEFQAQRLEIASALLRQRVPRKIGGRGVARSHQEISEPFQPERVGPAPCPELGMGSRPP
jgi:hypothetical protein